MRKNIMAYQKNQVFLNYPFDQNYVELEYAITFAVVAAGQLPVCAKDITSPDRPRFDNLVSTISNCYYSAHDLSRAIGEGSNNYARMNMPIEAGMAMFHALTKQRSEYRCAFFVATPNDYKTYASDLAGLDPFCHHNDEIRLVSAMYDWLRQVVPPTQINPRPTVEIRKKYEEFKSRLAQVDGSLADGQPTHDEIREVVYQVCEESQLWDWRANRAGKEEFPEIPLSWKTENQYTSEESSPH